MGEVKTIVFIHAPNQETMKRILDKIKHIADYEEETMFEYYNFIKE